MDSTALARRAGGLALLAVGILLIPLPGPGWPVVFAALALLGVPLPDLGSRLPRAVRAWLPSSSAA
jgi:hypothetical protein